MNKKDIRYIENKQWKDVHKSTLIVIALNVNGLNTQVTEIGGIDLKNINYMLSIRGTLTVKDANKLEVKDWKI